MKIFSLILISLSFNLIQFVIFYIEHFPMFIIFNPIRHWTFLINSVTVTTTITVFVWIIRICICGLTRGWINWLWLSDVFMYAGAEFMVCKDECQFMSEKSICPNWIDQSIIKSLSTSLLNSLLRRTEGNTNIWLCFVLNFC